MSRSILIVEHRIKQHFEDSIALTQQTDLAKEIQQATETICCALKAENRVMLCGNGGSMEQASHFAGELVGRFKMHRAALPATVLGINPVIVTAWSNDYEFTSVFARELEAIGRKGDILIGLSTSGNSKNVIEAVKAAKERGITTIGLLGQGGILRDMVDIPLCVPSTATARIQEVHLLLIHIISELVEDALFGVHES